MARPSSTPSRKSSTEYRFRKPRRRFSGRFADCEIEAVRSCLEPSSQYVFPSKMGGSAQSDLKRFWASASKQAGLNGIRLHDLRHTYASMLVSAGKTLPLIGALLGHTQPGTTARYSHLYDQPLREATEEVASTGNAVPGHARPSNRN